jgi:hypothetical protein
MVFVSYTIYSKIKTLTKYRLLVGSVVIDVYLNRDREDHGLIPQLRSGGFESLEN